MTFEPSSHPPERWRSVLSSLPVITLGLMLVTMAMLKAPWPPDPVSLTGKTVSFSERLQGQPPGPTLSAESAADRSAVWYGRRVLDGLALGLLVIGYLSVTLMIWSDEWRVLIVLTLVGIAGTIYGGLIGLYLGPILTTGGFALVLFGAGLNLISQVAVEAKYHERNQTERESRYDTHFAAQP
jgi:hypothetical protein